MKRILVTGAKGFIGKNLIVALKRRGDVDVIEYDLDSPADILEEGLATPFPDEFCGSPACVVQSR
jgi:UDP-2-acetamido-2,6-beta-L-arabino-hexul-4-ose reductase